MNAEPAANLDVSPSPDELPVACDLGVRLRVTATGEGKTFLTAAYEYLSQLRGTLPPRSLAHPAEPPAASTLLQKLKAACGC